MMEARTVEGVRTILSEMGMELQLYKNIEYHREQFSCKKDMLHEQDSDCRRQACKG